MRPDRLGFGIFLAPFHPLHEDPTAAFDECLAGGDAERGKKTFMTHLTAACIRCHRVGKEGSTVGPNLEDVATKRDTKYLLRSIVARAHGRTFTTRPAPAIPSPRTLLPEEAFDVCRRRRAGLRVLF